MYMYIWSFCFMNQDYIALSIVQYYLLGLVARNSVNLIIYWRCQEVNLDLLHAQMQALPPNLLPFQVPV